MTPFRVYLGKKTVQDNWGELIFRNSTRSECNHRGVILTPVVTRLLASLIPRRFTVACETLTRKNQAVFRPGAGCVNHVFTLRQVLKQRLMHKRPTILVFLDFESAFDSVDRSVLLAALASQGIPKNCGVCFKQSDYICPCCGIHHCSLTCYHIEEHNQYSGAFYRDRCIDSMRSRFSNANSRSRMLDILRREAGASKTIYRDTDDSRVSNGPEDNEFIESEVGGDDRDPCERCVSTGHLIVITQFRKFGFSVYRHLQLALNVEFISSRSFSLFA
ncbi:hypothetical protein T265_10118 [Opisthorchis viverrini]|uniref:HIT-type domain-containing protein n=1 Tax=Opisthorchis viverrini TaxID=6198 RepID=A0A074Z3F2_OPIVI|nr:hypothetical protein T265_10118 [Opisthorchis viverrini]KER21581.1 hypothetical protein T265_10118 [Opisthorchis viverrini]